MWWLQLIILVLASIPLGLYLWVKSNYSYFKNNGIPFEKPIFPHGNIKTLNKTESFGILTARFYNKLKVSNLPIVGLYQFISPTILVTSLDFVKKVFVADFGYFENRGIFYNEKVDPLSAHLFNIDQPKWKIMRRKLTPTFTSGRMKYMFSTMRAVSKEFVKTMEAEIEKSNEIEMKEILARFTTDIIGCCAFGLECNSLKDPEAKFREMGRAVFGAPKLKPYQRALMSVYPDLGRKLGYKMTRDEVEDFFIKCVSDTVNYRRKNNIVKSDFMNLMMEIGKDGMEEPLSITEIAAQAFIFFLAGFETSSTAMSFALYELSLNNENQQKARDEIKQVVAKYDGEITYESLLEMKYVEKVINESLRKYPPVPLLLRRATKDYKIEGTKIVIKKGTRVSIPVLGIHHDPQYYRNPEIFDPERFTTEEIEKRHPFAFIPFGEGPRNCIGLRFGMMQSKLGLASLIHNFKISLSDKTEQPIQYRKNAFILTTTSGMWIKFEKI